MPINGKIKDEIRDDVPALMELARVWRDMEDMARERGDDVDAELMATRKRLYVARLVELGALNSGDPDDVNDDDNPDTRPDDNDDPRSEL